MRFGASRDKNWLPKDQSRGLRATWDGEARPWEGGPPARRFYLATWPGVRPKSFLKAAMKAETEA